MQPIKLSLFQAFRRSLVLLIQAAPIELRYLILLTLISGAGSPITLFLNKIIIDETSRLLGQGATANPIDRPHAARVTFTMDYWRLNSAQSA